MNIHYKIEQLRQQPEHVKLRTVTLLTVVTGSVLAVLWLVVLLPLQLKLTNPSKNTSAQQRQAKVESTPSEENNLALPDTSSLPREGVVGGVQSWSNSQQALPDNAVVEVSPSPSEEPTPSVLPSVEPSTIPSSSPVEDNLFIASPTPTESSAPVQITH